MNDRPIGIFDSGLGGLTVLNAIHKLLPEENLVYFGDSGRAPYGTKSKETIIKYTFQDINFLLSQNVKMVVIACNTASACSLESVRKAYDIPIVEVVGPGARAAARATQSGHIGVIGTPATIASGVYERAIKDLLPECRCEKKACPLFVPLVEEGWWNHEISRLVAEEYLGKMKAAGVDSVVLGCTHYPLLSEVIQKVMGDQVVLINSAKEVALAVRESLERLGARRDSKDVPGMVKFYTSDSVDKFASLADMFLESPVAPVEKVEIEKEKDRP